MKIPAIATFLLCFTLLWAACQPPSNNNVTPTNPGNPTNPVTSTFHVSAPASGIVPDLNQTFGLNDSDFLTIIMTVANPQTADTVRYTIIEPSSNFVFLEKYDSVATGQSNDTGFGIGNFQRHIAFRHLYPNHADTTEEVKVAFWNAQHRDTVNMLIHSKKPLGTLKLEYDVNFLIKSFVRVDATGFSCYIESPRGDDYFWTPSWAIGNHSGDKDVEILSVGFYPPLSSTPVTYTHSTCSSAQSGGIPKFCISASGEVFTGSGASTRDTGVGQIMAWMGPQGPIMHVIPNVVLYTDEPGSQGTRPIKELELLY